MQPTYARTVYGFMPIIDTERKLAPYTRFIRFPKKTRATAAEAIRYAERVIHYRTIRTNEKRRKMEIISPSRFAA